MTRPAPAVERGPLDRFPRVELSGAPTPFHLAPRLSDALGAEVWLKRDDLTATGGGGNKVRKLEFLLGDAIATGADTVATFGALQSNHARQTAAACARLGLRCHLVLTRTVARTGAAFEAGGNVLLDRLFGASLHVCDADDASVGEAMQEVEATIGVAGGTARWIPPGGSEPIGALGYVAAGIELIDQATAAGIQPSDVVVATSTGGTHAGLLVGLALTGSQARTQGVAVYQGPEATAEAVTLLAAGTAELLGSALLGSAAPGPDDVRVIGDQLGAGYGVPTDDMREAVELVARTEGVPLDPVYSGKAAAALVAGCRSGALGADGPVVLVHTGGSPALFAYGEDVLTGG